MTIFGSLHTEASEPTESFPGSSKLGISSTAFGRWPGGVVTYVYNPTGAPTEFATDSYFLGLIDRAIDEIEGVSGVSFTFNGIDATANLADFTDDIVVIGWEDLGGAAGQAGPTSSCTGQDVIDNGYCPYNDGRVRFNNDSADVDWDSSGNTDTMERTLVQVATHEFLHLLGIGHSEQTESIMFADPYTNLSHLRDDDISALQSLYGEPDTFVAPSVWVTGPATAGDPFDAFAAFNDASSTEVTTVTDSDTSTFVVASWSVTGPYSETVSVVSIDPGGFYFQRNESTISCPNGFICSGWFSLVRVETMQTFRGDWKFEVIVNGATDEILTVDADVSPTVNEPPASTLTFDRLRGVAPFRFAGRLNVTSDPESDDADMTWHIPGDGETAVDFAASMGESIRDFTFDSVGDHEVYVEVNDDWTRYGAGGSAAGPGFRELYRKVLHVDKTLTDTVGLSDVNFDGKGDIAVLLDVSSGITNRLLVFNGDTGAILASRSLGPSPVSIKEIKAITDVNADGINDVAALGRHLVHNNVFIDITDPVTGAQIRRIYYGPGYEPIAIAEVPLGGGLGGTGLGVLGISDTGAIRVELKNSITGAAISRVRFGPAYYPQGIEVLASIDGDGVADYAVIGLNSAGNVRAQIRDTISGALESQFSFGRRFWPLAVRQGVDLDTNGVADLIVFGRDPTGRIRAEMRDALSGARTGINFFTATYETLDFVVVPDVGSPSLGVLGRHPTTGLTRVQLKNAATNASLGSVLFNLNRDPLGIAVVPDTNGAASELLVLGEEIDGDRLIQMKDAATVTQLLNQAVP